MTEDVMKTEGHTKEPKWYIDSVTTAGTSIAADGLFIGKIIDEYLAEVIVTAVNEQSERSALLKCEEALREMVKFVDHATEYELAKPWRFKPYDDANAALTLLDEARK